MHRAHLEEIYKELSGYYTSQCGMLHEKLTTDFVGNEESGEGTYQRYGLCCSKTRKMMLGCAHTGANDRFLISLKRLEHFPVAAPLTEPIKVIENIIYQIYMMDHQKGILEKQKRMESTRKSPQKLDLLTGQLDEIVAKHQVLINELELQRNAVLLVLKEYINTSVSSN